MQSCGRTHAAQGQTRFQGVKCNRCVRACACAYVCACACARACACAFSMPGKFFTSTARPFHSRCYFAGRASVPAACTRVYVDACRAVRHAACSSGVSCSLVGTGSVSHRTSWVSHECVQAPWCLARYAAPCVMGVGAYVQGRTRTPQLLCSTPSRSLWQGLGSSATRTTRRCTAPVSHGWSCHRVP